jgi:hypothetical protein
LQTLTLDVLHLKRSSDLYTTANGASNRAKVGVKTVHPFGHFAFGRVNLQVITDMNAPDYQHLPFQLNLACCL